MADRRRALLRGRRRHAVRVALATAAVVLVAYALGALVLDAVVVNRLTAQADARIAQALDSSGDRAANVAPTGVPPLATVPGDGADTGRDIDDAPRFAWFVGAGGKTVTLTIGAPRLPSRSWSTTPTTVDVAGTPFRFQAREEDGGWLVVGESLAAVDRVRDVLVGGELAVGVAVVVATFLGALAVGLLASAPVEVVRRRQAQFTADASHELRTPLSVIEAEVAVTLARPRERPAYEEALHRISDEAQRLRDIVDDLLWLARMDDERQVADPRATADAAAVARVGAERFRHLAATREIDLRLAPLPAEAWVRVEPLWLDRLAGVLLDNACKFAGDGGRVDVGVLADGATVTLFVDDSGPGVPADQRDFIFDRFHRGTDRRPGFGLGLAIADAIVRATGGQWAVDRSPLGGARFAVRWRQTTHHSEADAPDAPDAPDDPGGDGGATSTTGNPDDPLPTTRPPAPPVAPSVPAPAPEPTGTAQE